MLEIINTLGFPEPYWVEGRASIADLCHKGQRCGIYLLHFSNGEHYCGKAVDVTRRYIQHRKTHQDICQIQFKPVSENKLGSEEQHCIHALEAAGLHLRNIALMSMPVFETDFDTILSPGEQDRWLQGEFSDTSERMRNEELRRRYHPKFTRLLQMERIETVFPVLHKYATLGIPALYRGEVSFWSVSCLPGGTPKGVKVLLRINIGLQEVFTACYLPEDKDFSYSFHMARSPFKQESLKQKVLRCFHIPESFFDNHMYPSGGQDQINLIAIGAQSAMDLMDDKTVIEAIRIFNLRLMLKSPNLNGRAHCMDLADRMMG